MGVNSISVKIANLEHTNRVTLPIPDEKTVPFEKVLKTEIEKPADKPVSPKNEPLEYTVKPGDNLWKIGVKKFNKDPYQIARDNGLANPHLIRAGQKLKIYQSDPEVKQKVTACWYGKEYQNKITASGVPFDMNKNIVAHKTLPLGTKIRLFNPENGRTAVGQVADRGPAVKGRDLDVSLALAKKLGFVQKGVTELMIEVIS